MSDTYEYDFFISHASEDKDAFVRPLAEKLRAKGFSVWYDEYELTLGDSLRRSIEKGLASSRFGVVVLSEAFFSKEWPQKELDGLDALERDGRKVILPIWHEINKEYISGYSPMLAGRLAIATDKGIPAVAEAIEKAYRKGSAEAGSSTTASLTASGSSREGLLLLGSLEGQQLEDQTFTECTRNGSEGILRTMAMEFSALRRVLVDGRDVSELVGDEVQAKLSTVPAEAVDRAVRNSFSVRVALASAGLSDLDREIGEDLFDLHVALFSREDSFENTLNMQASIGAAAYACGAYAIMKKLPKLAKSLLGKFNPPDERGGRQWFRYLQIELERGAGDMINQVRSVWDGSDYLLDICGGEDKALNFLCQFDFLQCAEILASGCHHTECYPSFCAFRRHTVQPIVETLIETIDEGLWIPRVSASDLARVIHELEEVAGECAGFERPQWGIDRWSSPAIRLLLHEQGYQVR